MFCGKDFITVNITNSKNDNVSFEKRFQNDMTILELKVYLYIVTFGKIIS